MRKQITGVAGLRPLGGDAKASKLSGGGGLAGNVGWCAGLEDCWCRSSGDEGS
jgi:hypothetical protein